jgi:hypothetical protein
MQQTTMDDRRRELQALLEKLRDHPEHAMPEERERARVLSTMLAEADAARG